MKRTIVAGIFSTVPALITQTLCIALLFCITSAYAQKTPATDTASDSYQEMLSKTYSARNEAFLTTLKAKTTDKKLLKHYEANFKAIFETMKEEIQEGHMVNNPAMLALIEKLMGQIRAKNPVVPADIQLFLVRDNQPNAYALGDNTIMVNIGLFYYLENEDQIAGVLSHELGHLLMSHTLKALHDNYIIVKQTKENRTSRTLDLLKNSIYKGGRMRRGHEMQADSMGYILYKNAGYNKQEFVDALEIIDKYDTVISGNLLLETYKRFFDLPTQKFDEKWLKSEDFSSYNYASYTAKFDKDSIASHPKGKERIQHLVNLYPELKQKDAAKVKPSAIYTDIKQAAEKERIPNLYYNERYGEAVYMSLICLQAEPENEHYRKWLKKGLKKIYKARKDYQLNKFLDRIAPKTQTESYMRFLNFMWNLSLDEMKNISDYYSAKQ